MSDLEKGRFDVVIVGAGPHGLVAAKTFLQLSPAVNLLILDANRSVGGVWAKENIYPDLKANNQLGTFEFTDFNFLDVCPGRMREGEHIPGDAAHDYFSKYAQHFDLLRRVRFGHKVVTAEHLPGDGGWKLTVVRATGDAGHHNVGSSEKTQQEATMSISTSKLIVATGLTSTPMPISISGAASFSPPLMAFGDFRGDASRLLEDPNIKHVAVYGSAKSAYDAVYAFATRSIQVTWIIRESGHGPVWMTKSHIYLGPVRAWIESLVAIRPFSWLSPCIWGDSDGFGSIRRFLHQTTVGQWIVGAFWKKLGGDIIAQTGLRDKGPEVEQLVPKEGAMWYGTSFSILNYDTDIHKFVQDGTVKIVKRDIDRLDGTSIMFKTQAGVEKEHLDVDALICSKGWRWDSGIDFLPTSEHADLGVPSADYTPAQEARWNNLEAQADEEILERFPMLANGPGIHDDERVIPKPKNPIIANVSDDQLKSEPEKQRKEELTPWRLFRGIAPPANPRRDLVFLGMMSSLQTIVRSELSALWAYAYLNDSLSSLVPLSYRSPSPQQQRVPDEKDTKDLSGDAPNNTNNPWLYDSALLSRFGRWRFPMGYGARFPDYVFDGVPYWDLLMRDLGLRRWRKGWGWVGEVFGGAYMRAEYADVVDEWRWKGRV
ncbi:MAG: hypothetical protein L6R41_006791 [Letrouitia leprolyta]|nr:MAG: hypothetical protein L6R41_006791 [Letrouitia leprolyta]